MCECVTRINEALSPMNGRIAMALSLSADMSAMDSRIIVATEKIDTKKRKAAPLAVASFCPFCGDKFISLNKTEPPHLTRPMFD